MSPLNRPDPRDRPPDPAGTQPKVDPESLLPAAEPVPPAFEAEAVEEELEDAGRPPEPPSTDLVAAHGGPVATAIPRETRHTPRFQFLLGALLAVGCLAVAATVVAILGGGGSGRDAVAWSPWRPGGDDAVAQISDHIAQEYRLPSGRQLVVVTGGPLEVAGLPMQIALREGPAQGGNVSLLEGRGVLYRFCGLGPRCSIPTGRPSEQRALLLRREALELALYTFRYVDGVDQVVVFMPPPKGKVPDQALLFRRDDMKAALARPLSATLTDRTPSVAGMEASPDAALVNRITAPTLHRFSFSQANQEATVFLVLDPLITTVETSAGTK